MIMRRLLKGLFGCLALLLVLLVSLAIVVTQPAGSRWLLSTVPGLSVEGFDGALTSAWQAQRIVYKDQQQQIELLESQMQWQPSCLLRTAFCIDLLTVKTLNIILAESESSDESFSLPSIALPVDIEVGRLSLGELNIVGQSRLADLSLQASWRHNVLTIDSVGLIYGDYRLSLNGALQSTGDWPLELRAQLHLPAPDDAPWRIDLNAKGELQKNLTLHAQSLGYLEAELDGTLEALAKHLPAQLQLTSPAFKASASLPAEMTLEQVVLKASGDLNNGYQVTGNAQLLGVEQPIAVQLIGEVDAQGAQIDQLHLSTSKSRYAELNGDMDWHDSFSAAAKLNWKGLDWTQLWRQDEPLELEIQQLQAELAYKEQRYQGQLQGTFDGPAGVFGLSTLVDGDLEQVQLNELVVNAGEGRLQGQLQLGFAEGFSWQTELAVKKLNPAYWLEQMPGQLSGQVISQGKWGELLAGSANVQLEGRLRGQTARLDVQAHGQGQQWQVPQLAVRLGSNQIQGQGQIEQNIRAQLQIKMPQLQQLWTDLHGALNGQLNLSGSLAAPQGDFSLSGQRIQYAGNHLERLELKASLGQNQQAKVDLLSQGIHLGEWLLGQMSLSGQGSLQQQQLSLKISGDDLQAAFDFTGRLSEQNQTSQWQGQLRSASVEAGEQQWRLDKSVPIDYQAGGQLYLGAMCWRALGASLCGDKAQLAPNLQLNYQLKNFDLAGLAPFLPEDFAWQGQLFANVELRTLNSAPQGKISVRADNGIWRVRSQGDWLDLPYQQLNFTSQLKPNNIDAVLRFAGDSLGSIDGVLQIDPRGTRKPIRGNLRLQGLELGVLRPFIDQVGELSGKLQGSAEISGDLLNPQVNGNILLSDGRIMGGIMPTDIDQLRVQAQIAGEQIQLSGNWRSGDKGQASLTGEFTWNARAQGELRLIGSNLPIKYEPYASVEANPDLTLNLTPQRISISGEIEVPRGQIEVRELPESTVSVSSDAQVIGREADASKGPQLLMNVLVKVGSDRLSFSAFGLTADLVGSLRITDNLETRGELELVKGRFRAYGQRLSLRRALLTFNGPISQPFLDVEAVRRVEGVLAGLRIRGPASQPRSDVFSEPPMNQEEALSYLVLGRPMIAGAGSENNMLAQAALNLGLAGTSKITGGLMSRLGISDFDLDAEGEGDDASVVASGRLSERLSVFYGLGVFNPMATFGLRYTITQKLYLEAASGLASSIDLFYRRDF